MRALFRYHLLVFGVILLTLCGGFFLNTWVNPWRMTPAPWTAAKFEEYRGIDRTANRTAKAGLAGSRAWEAAIFGSSRVDIGFDPLDPAWRGLKVANLGLDAANIDENEAMFDYFMERQSPSLVVFLVDAGDLTKPDPVFNGTDFSNSPLVTTSQPLERELRYHTGITALSSSINLLKRAAKHQPGDHTPEGFRRVATRVLNARAQIASLYISTICRLAREQTTYNRVNPAKVERIRRIIATCRQKGCRLVFAFPPNHAMFQRAFVELQTPDPYFQRDRELMAGLVADANRSDPAALAIEVWDFQDTHPLNCPALPQVQGEQMTDWIDIFHFVPQIGALMIRRIQGEAGDYGVRLTPENVPARIDSIRNGLQEWAEKHPDDLDFLRQSLKAFGTLPGSGESR